LIGKSWRQEERSGFLIEPLLALSFGGKEKRKGGERESRSFPIPIRKRGNEISLGRKKSREALLFPARKEGGKRRRGSIPIPMISSRDQLQEETYSASISFGGGEKKKVEKFLQQWDVCAC